MKSYPEIIAESMKKIVTFSEERTTINEDFEEEAIRGVVMEFAHALSGDSHYQGETEEELADEVVEGAFDHFGQRLKSVFRARANEKVFIKVGKEHGLSKKQALILWNAA